MSAASNAQVQTYSDAIVRPLSEQIRALYLSCKSAKGSLNDVYANLTASNPPTTWTDERTDSPPHLAAPGDLLAWNAFISNFIGMVEGTLNSIPNEASDFGVIESLCVRPVQL